MLTISAVVAVFAAIFLFYAMRPTLILNAVALCVVFCVVFAVLYRWDKRLYHVTHDAGHTETLDVIADEQVIGHVSHSDLRIINRSVLFDLRTFGDLLGDGAVVLLKVLALSSVFFVLFSVLKFFGMSAEEFKVIHANQNNELYLLLGKLAKTSFGGGLLALLATYGYLSYRISFSDSYRAQWMTENDKGFFAAYRKAFEQQVAAFLGIDYPSARIQVIGKTTLIASEAAKRI